jgi:hypothetical protein
MLTSSSASRTAPHVAVTCWTPTFDLPWKSWLSKRHGICAPRCAVNSVLPYWIYRYSSFMMALTRSCLRKQAMGTVEFSCDLRSRELSFCTPGSTPVGSCHAPIALARTGGNSCAAATPELEFRHVRFHGPLSDDVGTMVDTTTSSCTPFSTLIRSSTSS